MIHTSAWQPIETAPKNGTVVLTWGDVPNFVRVSYFDSVQKKWNYYPYPTQFKVDQPTHWQPLPKGPKNERTVYFGNNDARIFE